MSKFLVHLGFLSLVLAIDIQATTSKGPSWREVSSTTLDNSTVSLIEPNIGGRAALCSWVVEDKDSGKNTTNILVGTIGGNGKCGINKLVYNLSKKDPTITSVNIDLNGFRPRAILRTNNGVLYLTANSDTSSDWLAHWKLQKDNANKDKTKAKYLLAALETPKELLGGVWVSIDDGDTWIELLTIDGKSIMNAGYMACYRVDTKNKSDDDTVIRVGGAGISSTEIAHFTDRYKAEEYKEYTQVRLQNCCSATVAHIAPDYIKIKSLGGSNYFVISAMVNGTKSNCNGILTRIGELPISYDGTDLQLNAIKFSYVIANHLKEDKRGDLIASYVNFGTPIFGNYHNSIEAGENCEKPSHRLEDLYFLYKHDGESSTACPPEDYWHADIHKAESSAYKKHESSDTTDTTKDKYYNCVATYDNTGLFLAKLNSKKENIVEAYTGAIDKNLKAPSKYADDFSYPQEIVAQYDGFMAIANNENEVQIRKVSNSNDSFDKTVFDNSSFNRVMIAGVQPLDWHSSPSDRKRYNGRLIAIGQHSDQFLLKLYMLPTQSIAERANVNGVDTIKCKITGEPYAKVKYWFQQADSDGKFAQLTRSNIEAGCSSIVYKNEANLDQYGSYSVNTYKPKQTGKYRLVTSAVVGGFYCDCDINQPDNIGTPSNDIDIKIEHKFTRNDYWSEALSTGSGIASGMYVGFRVVSELNHVLVVPHPAHALRSGLSIGAFIGASIGASINFADIMLTHRSFYDHNYLTYVVPGVPIVIDMLHAVLYQSYYWLH